MYLKNLEMQGFKSFPDKVSLDFSQGLTMIVGPNGSGKSNISDAIRWVLGEQSVKHLRGSKMEDVIFSGTQDRKALGFAEVSITIDNSDRRMEIDFSEITVTRRVFRSGESEYFINGAACRLKDIHEVFMDTGLGRDGYSVVGQGKIDEILSNKAEDRRQIFEEAAGISKYKYRKLEAERKLSGTEGNLTRLYDILTELEDRLTPLERQSETAKKYLLLREQLKKLEVSVSVENIAKFRKMLSEIEQTIADTGCQLEQAKIKMDSLDREIAALYEGNSETDQKIAGLREAISSEEGQIKQRLSEIAIFQDTIRQNHVAVERLESEERQFADSILETSRKQAEKKQEIANIAASIEKTQGELKGLLQSFGQAEQQVRLAEEALKEKNEDLVEGTAELGELKAALSHVDTLEQAYQNRLEELKNSQKEKEEERIAVNQTLDETEHKAALCQQEKERLLQQLKEVEMRLKAAEEEASRQNELLQKQQAAYRFKIDRIKMLTEMEREYEGYQKGAKSILQNKDGALKTVRIHGALSQLIRVDSTYVTAVETALGQGLQNIVTETEEDAKQAITYLKQNKLGRVTFLPVSSVTGRSFGYDLTNCPGFLGLASNLVQTDGKYQEILSSLLGATVVTDTLDHAIQIAKKYHHKFRIVTLEGDLCNVGGSMSGGFVNKQAGILSRANDKQKLTTESGELKKQIERQHNEIAKIERQKEMLEEKHRTIFQKEQEQTGRLIQLAAEQKHLLGQKMSLQKALEELAEAQSQVATRVSEIQEQTAQKRERLQEITAGSALLEQDAAQAQLSYEEAVSSRESLSHQMTRCRMAVLDYEKNSELAREQMNSLDSSMRFDQNERLHRLNQIEETKEKNRKLESDIAFKQHQIQELTVEINENRGKIMQFEQSRQGDQEAIASKQEQSRQSREQLLLLQQEYGRVENKKAKIEFEIDAIVNRLWEDYGLTHTTALEYKTELISLTKAQKEIALLKKEITSLGHINIDAIEEYKQVKERFTFLSGQRDDLLEAKGALEKVIKEMQGLMKTIFVQQFDTINIHFAETFQQLFGGGKAKLYLSDPSNVLESGVEIEVQPPGKKLQNMMLLSGGEKAMCAIAILFAIIKTRPAPFCIFDEIEAALDDVNVVRFANYLKAFHEKTQFIVVTHRRGTMEAADRLYGITMEKKGISRMIMLDMDQLDEFHQNNP